MAAPQCSVKPLCKAVDAISKLMYKKIEIYYFKSH